MKKLITASTLALGILGMVYAQGTPAPVKIAPPTSPSTPVATPTQEAAQPELPLTVIKFAQPEFNFGVIDEGKIVEHTFEFTNAGENPLVLESVKPSCGCTSLDYTKGEIAPGKTGYVKIQFNSLGKPGEQLKYVTIIYNGNPNMERVMFKGTVTPKPQPAPAPGTDVAPAPAPAPAPVMAAPAPAKAETQTAPAPAPAKAETQSTPAAKPAKTKTKTKPATSAAPH